MTTIQMKLKPWAAPNYALLDLPAGKREEGMKETPSIPVEQLTEEALDGLAAQWLRDLYMKAGKLNGWALARSERAA